jgi:hypothetical protein
VIHSRPSRQIQQQERELEARQLRLCGLVRFCSMRLAMNVPGGNLRNGTILQRRVARIDRPTVQRGMTPQHRVRPLIPPGDPKATDPLLLLMEDWFPRGVFDRHPHRGMGTVTYVVDGRLDHYDNYGTVVLRAGGARSSENGEMTTLVEMASSAHRIHGLYVVVRQAGDMQSNLGLPFALVFLRKEIDGDTGGSTEGNRSCRTEGC